MAIKPFKTCLICAQDFAAEHFYSYRQSKDGFYPYCKPCERKRRLRKKLEADPELAEAYKLRDAAFENAIPGEVWKDIPDWVGVYQASSLGRVRSLPRAISAPNRWGACIRRRKGQIIRQRGAGNGHLVVGLSRGGKPHPVMVHRLVCEAFHGKCPPEKQHCAHWDGNPKNNRPENLRWATVSENAEDSRRHGTMRVGSKSNLSKLNEADVLEIRRLNAEDGLTGYRIAKLYGVNMTCIYKILNKQTWRHV